MNTFRGIQTVRVGLWAALQIMLLFFVFPELGVYRSEEQEIRMCFEASAFSLVSIVIIVPMFRKASPSACVVLVLMLAFPAWVLYGVLRIRGII
jgi:hypothetical protein